MAENISAYERLKKYRRLKRKRVDSDDDSSEFENETLSQNIVPENNYFLSEDDLDVSKGFMQDDFQELMIAPPEDLK